MFVSETTKSVVWPTLTLKSVWSFVIISADFSDITCLFTYGSVSETIFPSSSRIFETIYGLISLPPLPKDATAVIIWIGEIWNVCPNDAEESSAIYSKVIEIFEKSYKQEPIRLIGVRLSDLTTTRKIQISLFEEESEQDEEDSFQKTLDAINNKFGKDLVAPASLKAITKRTEK